MDKTVIITQVRLTHYRMAFFKALRDQLSIRGVNLILLHGQLAPNELSKQDQGQLDWATNVSNKYYKIGNSYIVWQPLSIPLDNVDLLVITQENRIISNLFNIFKCYFSKCKIAFWGHGANLQSKNQNSPREIFKRWSNNFVDWWFAYTQMSFDLVKKTGFPENRITVLNNAVDTTEFKEIFLSISNCESAALLDSLGFSSGSTCIFVGSLYADKRLEFLFAAADKIKQQVPDFYLIIIGEGNQANIVKTWCDNRPWVKWVGARFGREKALYLSLSKLMLNPGLVGLGILDSFVSSVPIVTTNCGIHSTEIAYLENGVNGIMTENDIDIYADTCVELLKNQAKLKTLCAGCRFSSEEYTVEKMAIRFADGIVLCLESTKK